MKTKAQREIFEQRLIDWSNGKITFDTPAADHHTDKEVTGDRYVLSVKDIMTDHKRLQTGQTYMEFAQKHCDTVTFSSLGVGLMSTLLGLLIGPMVGLSALTGGIAMIAILCTGALKNSRMALEVGETDTPLAKLTQVYLDTRTQSLHYAFTRIDRKASTMEQVVLDIPKTFVHETRVTGNAKEAIRLYKSETAPETEAVLQYVEAITNSIKYENEKDIQNLLNRYYDNSPAPIDTPLYQSLKAFSDQNQKTLEDNNARLDALTEENETIIMNAASDN